MGWPQLEYWSLQVAYALNTCEHEHKVDALLCQLQQLVQCTSQCERLVQLSMLSGAIAPALAPCDTSAQASDRAHHGACLLLLLRLLFQPDTKPLHNPLLAALRAPCKQAHVQPALPGVLEQLMQMYQPEQSSATASSGECDSVSAAAYAPAAAAWLALSTWQPAHAALAGLAGPLLSMLAGHVMRTMQCLQDGHHASAPVGQGLQVRCPV